MKKKLSEMFRDIDGHFIMTNILIVEDNHSIRGLLKSFLAKIGFDPECLLEADNGLEGLRLLEKKKITLTFTDINMPQMNGLEMLAHMREHPKFNSSPSIVISSERDEGLIESVIKSGYGFVRKPFTIQSIKNEILNLDSLRYAEYVQA